MKSRSLALYSALAGYLIGDEVAFALHYEPNRSMALVLLHQVGLAGHIVSLIPIPSFHSQ